MKYFNNNLVAVNSPWKQRPTVDEAAEIALSNCAALTIIVGAPGLTWPVRMSMPYHEYVPELIVQEKR